MKVSNTVKFVLLLTVVTLINFWLFSIFWKAPSYKEYNGNMDQLPDPLVRNVHHTRNPSQYETPPEEIKKQDYDQEDESPIPAKVVTYQKIPENNPVTNRQETFTSSEEILYSITNHQNTVQKSNPDSSKYVNVIRGDKVTKYDLYNATNLSPEEMGDHEFKLVLRNHDIKAVLIFSDHRTGSSQLMHRFNQCGPLNFWELFKQENSPQLMKRDLTYLQQKEILLDLIYSGDRIWKIQARQFYDFYYVANDVFQEENIFFVVNERLDVLDKCFSWTNIQQMYNKNTNIQKDRGNIWNGVDKDDKKGLKNGIDEVSCSDRKEVNDFYFENIKRKLDIYKKSYMIVNYENTHELERILDIDLSCVSELK